MNIAIIPARGGSKRIPRKNIKAFHGKPMIAYSIEAAVNSQCFDKIIVSTDDAEIAEVAIKHGAEVPFIRPDNISDDYATTLDVIKHAIEFTESQGWAVKNVCCIYATAPFLIPEFIQKGLDELTSAEIDYAFSATSFPFPIQRALKLSDEQRVEMFQPEHLNTRSQDLEEAYHDAGQFYWGTKSAFLKRKPFFSPQSKAVLLPRKRVQDIDTNEDWELAEALYKALQ
ncbi:pseudaminic acid cytidylyltransferase [Pseudoalteromonas issachenkonii]|uniref:pseudaminic acid cytidylyltransferase n=1 Tax=Pseudoalteromonas issachenkonii TaxID=152297 RepID=UPI0023568C69|nr:pseudaminic acid cytidylyltransferase [Pseudoalteromonas issachenkonii]|tara:strand:- start:2676 stop:3359 length:684 start_codon:yes stop_codon:yes gene_type:complete